MSELLSSLLQRDDIVLAPGIYDAFTGLLAEQAGARTAYLSGASIAYTRLGRPDIGLVSVSEVADTLALITDLQSVNQQTRSRLPSDVELQVIDVGVTTDVGPTLRQFSSAPASPGSPQLD